MPPRLRDPRFAERKIYFYRAFTGFDEAGLPFDFDPTAALAAIESLSGTPERYLEEGDRVTICWRVSSAHRPRVRVANVRRADLPLVEENGDLRSLGLTQDQGIAEQIHVVFFPHNIVGADFNFYGPRLTRLAEYMEIRCGVPRIEFQALMRRNVFEQLDRMTDITMFELRIQQPYVDVVNRADGPLAAGFRAAFAAGEAHEVEIVLHHAPRSQTGLAGGLMRAARQLARQGDLRQGASSFKVTGFDPEIGLTEVDILHAQLVSTKAVLRQGVRDRALDSASAFDAIEAAHEELSDEIERAAPVEQP